MVVADTSELYTMSVNSLWANYVEAMDYFTMLKRAPAEFQNDEEAKFYEAVANVSLTLYFEGVEIVLAELNRGTPLEQSS